MKNKIAKFISYITVVPIIAFFTILLIYIHHTKYFFGIEWFIYSIIFLTIIPILAYPIHRIIPAFKREGRKSERKLAFIFAVISYVIGTLFTFIFSAPVIVKKIFRHIYYQEYFYLLLTKD